MPDTRQSHQIADLAVGGKPFSVTLHVQLTPGGLWAIAGLVSGILLSTAVVVWAARHKA